MQNKKSNKQTQQTLKILQNMLELDPNKVPNRYSANDYCSTLGYMLEKLGSQLTNQLSKVQVSQYQINTDKSNFLKSSYSKKRIMSSLTSSNLKEISKMKLKSKIQNKLSHNKHNRKSLGKIWKGSMVGPGIILPKNIRKDPFITNNKIHYQDIQKKGIYYLVNLGSIPITANLNPLFNLKPPQQIYPQRKPQFEVLSKEKQIFLTDTHLQNKIKPNIPRITIDKKQFQIYIRVQQWHVLEDQVFFIWKNNALGEGLWIVYKEFLTLIVQLGKKAKLTNFRIKVNKFPESILKKPKRKQLIKYIENFKAFQKVLKHNEQLKHIQYLQQFSSNQSVLIAMAQFVYYRCQYIKIKNKNKEIKKEREESIVEQFLKRLKQNWLNVLEYVQRQNVFKKQFLKNQKSQQVHIHIANFCPSNNLQSFYRYKEREMISMTRIFHLLTEKTEIIYIFPQMQQKQQLIRYIIKIIEKTNKKAAQKVNFFWAQNINQSIEKAFFYSINDQILNSIYKIIKGKLSFIIPQFYSLELILLANILNMPVYSGNIILDQSQLSQTETMHKFWNNPYKCFFTNYKKQQQYFNQVRTVLPKIFKKTQINQLINMFYGIRFCNNVNKKSEVKNILLQDIKPVAPGYYKLIKSKNQFYTVLSQLIIKNKQYNRWIFKIDNQVQGRGIAYFQTDQIKLIKQKKKKQILQQFDWDQLDKVIELSLDSKIIVVHQFLYTKQQFIDQFIKQGGIIEADLKSVQVFSYIFDINPQGDIVYEGCYKKISICQYMPSLIQVPALDFSQKDIQNCNKLCKKLFNQYNITGKVTIELFKIEQNLYYNSIETFFNMFTSAFYFYKFICCQEYQNKVMMYCPFVNHSGLKGIQMQKFFKQCNNYDISFTFSNDRRGSMFLFLGLKTQQQFQFLSIIVIQSDFKKCVKYMNDTFNFLLSFNKQVTKFQKGINVTNIDCWYIMDIVTKIRQLNKIIK